MKHKRLSAKAGNICLQCVVTGLLMVTACVILLQPIGHELWEGSIVQLEALVVLSSLVLLLLPACCLLSWCATHGGQIILQKFAAQRLTFSNAS